MTKEQLASIIELELAKYDFMSLGQIETDSDYSHIDVTFPDGKRLVISTWDSLI